MPQCQRLGTFLVVSLIGCTSGSPSTDAGPLDAGAEDAGPADAGAVDAGTLDAGSYPGPMSDAGTISPLFSGQVEPDDVAWRGGTLYWTDSADPGSVMSAPLDGGAPVTIALAQHSPESIISDSNNLYWINYGTTTGLGVTAMYNNDGQVMRTTLTGSNPITLASEQPGPGGIAVDSTNVYWTTAGALGGSTGLVLGTPIDGGVISTLFSGQASPTSIAVAGSALVWANGGTADIMTAMYNNDGAVLQSPAVDGGMPITLLSGQEAPYFLTTDAKNVYLANAGQLNEIGIPLPSTGSIVQVSVGGGNVVTLATNQDVPVGIAVNDSTVFWINNGSAEDSGSIAQVPIGGGAVETLVTGAVSPAGLVLVGTDVIWSDFGTGVADGALLQWSP